MIGCCPLPIPLPAQVVVAIRGDFFLRHDQSEPRLKVVNGLMAAQRLQVFGQFGLNLRELLARMARRCAPRP